MTPRDVAERLSEALRPFAAICADHGETFSTYPPSALLRCEVTAGEIQQARLALESAQTLDDETSGRGISEALLSSEDASPEAAARRIIAFLDFLHKVDVPAGTSGPTLNYADMRIVSRAILAGETERG